MKTIDFSTFEMIELRTGTIIEVSDFPAARKPAYILKIDFGEEIGILKSSARITELYSRADLMGKQIIAVVNFESKQIGPVRSQCLVTGFVQADGRVVLAVPDRSTENGLKLS